jgi:hypothetical protein
MESKTTPEGGLGAGAVVRHRGVSTRDQLLAFLVPSGPRGLLGEPRFASTPLSSLPSARFEGPFPLRYRLPPHALRLNSQLPPPRTPCELSASRS